MQRNLHSYLRPASLLKYPPHFTYFSEGDKLIAVSKLLLEASKWGFDHVVGAVLQLCPWIRVQVRPALRDVCVAQHWR